MGQNWMGEKRRTQGCALILMVPLLGGRTGFPHLWWASIREGRFLPGSLSSLWAELGPRFGSFQAPKEGRAAEWLWANPTPLGG